MVVLRQQAPYVRVCSAQKKSSATPAKNKYRVRFDNLRWQSDRSGSLSQQKRDCDNLRQPPKNYFAPNLKYVLDARDVASDTAQHRFFPSTLTPFPSNAFKGC